MLKKEDAKNLLYQNLPSVMQILDDFTIEDKEVGWIFYYLPERFMKTGFDTHLRAGPTKCLVDKNLNEIEFIGPWETSVELLLSYKTKHNYPITGEEEALFLKAKLWQSPKISLLGRIFFRVQDVFLLRKLNAAWKVYGKPK